MGLFPVGVSAAASGAGRQWRPFSAGLRCHSGRSWTRPTGAQDPKRELRPVAGRVPLARSDPSPGVPHLGRRPREDYAKSSLAHRPKRAPPFGVSDGGGARLVVPPWSHLRVEDALGHPPPDLRCRVGRFAAERHWRSLTPSHAPTLPKGDSVPAWEGEIYLYSHSKGGLHPPLGTPWLPLWGSCRPRRLRGYSLKGAPKGVAAPEAAGEKTAPL